ncbi:hypothetical protein DERF_009468 [Dermatophagoides farinae]|uniref:Uncharacterized protein n=1 Tax=Dermatophagoides farinae TaxID=6954 RepID=A0A922L2K8_DERFA|nr:hypothetical protein DERF_009468 [Dermatophagoides farinae]
MKDSFIKTKQDNNILKSLFICVCVPEVYTDYIRHRQFYIYTSSTSFIDLASNQCFAAALPSKISITS